MIHKKYGIILGSILTIAAMDNGYATLSTAEKAFFAEHKDAFAQKVFVDDINKALVSPSQLFCDALAFLIPTILGMSLTTRAKNGHSIKTDEFINMDSVLVGGPIGIVCLWLYLKHAKNTVVKEAFISFLQQYFSNAQLTDDNNLRLYIPQNLVATFDEMAKEYKRIGPDYFDCDEFATLVELIQKEVVKNNSGTAAIKTNKNLTLIVCLAAITSVIINALTFKKVERGLYFIHDSVDYWGTRNSILRHMDQ